MGGGFFASWFVPKWANASFGGYARYDTPVDNFLEKVGSLLVTVLFGFEPEVV
jgi:hypothetical protein